MKINSILAALFLLLTISASAQTYVDIPWREGSIIKKGEEEKGMIRLGGDLAAPWLNNSKVYFVPTDKWVEGKSPRKKVIEEFKPENIQGYSTYTEDQDDNRVEMNFKTYEIMVMGAIRKKKGKAFLKLEESGKVDLLSYVPAPTKKIVTTANERKKDKESALNRYRLYLKKGDGDLMLVSDSDLVVLLQDCPFVVDKIQKEEYGFKLESAKKKRKGLGKMVAKEMGNVKLQNGIYEVVRDYNNCAE